MTTPADELRTAAATLRDVAPSITGPLAGLADPVADWLEHEAEMAAADHLWAEREPCGWCGTPAGQHALAVARAINGRPAVTADDLTPAAPHPTETRFRLEIHGGDGQWTPCGKPTTHRHALNALDRCRAVAETWGADGESVRWRVAPQPTECTVEAAS